MGVEKKVYVIPRNNSFRPPAGALAGFVERLRQDDWVADPARPWFGNLTFTGMKDHKHAKATGGYVERPGHLKDDTRYSPLPLARSDMDRLFAEIEREDRRVRWPVSPQGGRTGLHYPLNAPPPISLDEAHYNVELWLANEHVYVTSETIEPFPNTACRCGASLEQNDEDPLFYATRLRTRCDACGALTDVSERLATWHDPGTNAMRRIPGGATFRFALVIDCSKCWPNPPAFGVNAELKALCEACFEQPFYDVLDVY
jgi:hypothetical protein